jgi:hypothetical protein
MSTRAFAFAVVLTAVLSAGCAQDRMSLEIQAGCYPSDDCTFADACDTQFIGTYAVVANTSLRIFLQVANQVPNNEDLATGRVNSNDAHVTGVTVDFAGARSGTFDVTSIANQIIPAGGTAVIGITIPASAATTGTVNAQVRMTGYYDNGREFETGDFPVNYNQVAAGSLTSCSGTDVVTCPGLPPGAVATTRVQQPSACAAP